jgi:hypothetical protein
MALAVLLLAGLALATLTDAQNQTPERPAPTGEPDAAKGVWVVRFEPVGDFSPKTPGDFLSKIHVYSGQSGQIGYFRTTKQGDKLVGSFLAYDPDQLKAALGKIPSLRVTAVEKLTQEQLAAYEKSPQESLLDIEHLDAAKGVWVVRFEPVGDFAPKTPEAFLSRIHVHSGQSGEIGYFRTTKQGDKLVGSFLAYDPDQLKAALGKIPSLKVTAVEKLTQEQLADYEKSPQESLLDFNHLDAAKGVWVVRFEPVGDFAPKTPEAFLSKIHVYSGQSGQIGYFRTTKQGDKLVGSFLAYDPDELKTALGKISSLKVTSVQKLTQEQLADYEKSPQESLMDFEHLDASKGVWVVSFEPVGEFAPKNPGEFLSRIHVYSGQSGEIGYFRTTKQGDRLVGSFLAFDPDQLKEALGKIPSLKVTAVKKLTEAQLAEYEKSPQESL